MGVQGFEDQSPVPETYFGPMERKPWWDPSEAKSAVFLDHDATSEEALVAAGIDWPVEHRPLFYSGRNSDGDLSDGGAPHRAGREMGIVRVTDDAYLGSSKPGFRIFQQRELIALGDAILGEGAYWHTGGSLYGGSIVWLLAKFDKAIHVKGDGSPIDNYLALINGHDGRHGCTIASTMTRVWCGNTCQQVLAGASDKIVLRHVPGMEKRVEQVKEAIGVHVHYRETLEAVLNDLAARPMTIDEVRAFTVDLLPVAPDVKNPARTQAKRDLITALFALSPTLEGVPRTAYRAYQAVVEASDQYVRARDTATGAGADRQAMSVFEGTAYDRKSDAIRLLVKA